jgi:ATP adenylyltransferase
MPKPLWAPWRLEYIEQADDTAGCIFCEPDDAMLVHEGATAIVLLNKFPYASGHLLVAPRRHTGDFGGLTDDEALEVHRLGSAGVATLTEAYSPHGFNLGWNLGRVAGAGIVDHVHLHVVPRWKGDTNFMPVLGDVRVLPQLLEDSWRDLRAAFDELEKEGI